MLAHDVQREVDVTSKSDVSGVYITLPYTLLWTSFCDLSQSLVIFFFNKPQ